MEEDGCFTSLNPAWMLEEGSEVSPLRFSSEGVPEFILFINHIHHLTSSSSLLSLTKSNMRLLVKDWESWSEIKQLYKCPISYQRRWSKRQRVFVTQNSGQGIRIGFARAHKYKERRGGGEEKSLNKKRKTTQTCKRLSTLRMVDSFRG